MEQNNMISDLEMKNALRKIRKKYAIEAALLEAYIYQQQRRKKKIFDQLVEAREQGGKYLAEMLELENSLQDSANTICSLTKKIFA